MRNLPEMLILMMGIAAAGGVLVFLNAWWTSKELTYALVDSGAELFLQMAHAKKHLRLVNATKA